MKVFAVMKGEKMLKIGTDDKSARWYFLTDKVREFVKKAIKKGDEVEIKHVSKNGDNYITFIEKSNGETKATDVPTCEDCGRTLKDAKYKKCYTCNEKAKQTPPQEGDGKKYCECGTEIKNPKYPTCYKCSQEKKEQPVDEPRNNAPEYACSICGKELKDDKYDVCYTCNLQKEQSPEGQSKQKSIKRQAIGNMTSRTLIALQGQISVDEVDSVARKIYKLYQELVG